MRIPARATRRLLAVVAAATLVPLVPPATPALAHGSRIEAEEGTSVYPRCGEDGPMQPQPGGTGAVMFFPGITCEERFPGYDPRYEIASVTYWVEDFSGTLCGQFYFNGAINGESTPVCTGPDQWITAPVTLERLGTGTWTMQWVFQSGTARLWDANARVDYLTLASAGERRQEEFGTAIDGCFGDNGMRVENGGTGQVVMYPTAGCARRHTTYGERLEVTSITYWMTGQDVPMCGYFRFTGAVSGRSATQCAASGVTVTSPVTSTSHGTGDYTVTWQTANDTPSWVNAYVDYHDRARVHATEAESGTRDECATADHGFVVFSSDGCAVTYPAAASPAVLDSLVMHLDGGSGTLCGRFEVTGGITGWSDEACATRWSLVTPRFRTTWASATPYTLAWRPSASSPAARAHLDRFTAVPAIAEAEDGVVSSSTCGGDTTTRRTSDGAHLGGSGCKVTLQSPGHVAVVAARFRLSGVGGYSCGYFSFEGAITGRTDYKCADLVAGADTYADVPATATAVSGGAWTATWITQFGTLVTTDAELDRLVLAAT